ncbi:MAG: hypothetical protein E7181_04500 [Erysipelotrichaceae bacterium]|nr:hypothetical protein [Erysipelotrichaceae bacterium]
MKKLLLFVIPFLLCGCSTSGSSVSESSKTSEESSKSLIPSDSNILVAYFSVTNHTKEIAVKAQEYLESDIFEIVPSQEYTAEDINYNSDCRANREQNDPNARPVIKYSIEDISKYDTIVLGYPIWWGQAPKIMYTFVESYDLTNKTIIPFCTSGSSPIGSSAINLAIREPNANWLEGKRFPAGATKEDIASWLDSYIDKEEKDMKLLIDEKELNVSWEDNDSVKALKNLLPLTINMHEYGGFEQTGSIGSSIIRNDRQIDVVPGDIVLYNGNAISVFYNNSAWSYTRLGHINMDNADLNNLLNKASVTFVLK